MPSHPHPSHISAPLPQAPTNPQKRNRSQLSCTSCRAAKLKCDRQQPCSQCMKKGRAETCCIPKPVERRRPAVSMHKRLMHLESLVKGAMSGVQNGGQSGNVSVGIEGLNGYGNKNGNEDNIDNERDEFRNANGQEPQRSGQVVNGPGEATYVGATHWAAILEDIEEVKHYFREEEAVEDEDIRPYSSLVFNAQTPSSKMQLLEGLPEKRVVDKLVGTYFNCNSPALHLLHRPTFEKDYRLFWESPETSSLSFIALIYAILTLATFASLSSGDSPPEETLSSSTSIQHYRQSCVQSLILSNYTKPGPFTMETLIIYMESEFLLSKDDQVHCYLLVGNTVRLALRMGLHRDSTKINSKITPYQAEMRRRIWHHLIQIDLLVSVQIGLPGTAESIDSDTLYPSNLLDSDFSEDCPSLPTPRPESEITPLSYTIAKSRICSVSKKISRLANALSLPAYSEILELDSLLTASHAQTPAPFLLGENLSITDSSSLTIKKMSLALLYHKSKCMLHRKYLLSPKPPFSARNRNGSATQTAQEIEKRNTNQEYEYSRTTSLQAALQLLKCQALVHEAGLPGGMLSRDRWFLSSLSMHDFLLAAMIVFLSLMRCLPHPSSASKKNSDQGAEEYVSEDEIKVMIDALERSYAIWQDTWVEPHESRKAKRVLGIMVKKVRLGFGGVVDGELSEKFEACERGAERLIEGLVVDGASQTSHTFSKAMDTQPLSTETYSPTHGTNLAPPPEREIQYPVNDMEIPLYPLLDTGFGYLPDGFDWELFDNEIRPQPSTDFLPVSSLDFPLDGDDFLDSQF